MSTTATLPRTRCTCGRPRELRQRRLRPPLLIRAGAAMVLALAVLASLASAEADDLVYIERSDGLEEPGMEAGRTEIEFGDVNADGFLDIVSIGDHGSPFVNTQEHGIMVWFGDGLGHWTVLQNGNFGYGGVALGDVNGDGHLDVGYGMHHNWGGGDFGDQLLEVALGDGTGQNWTPWDDGLASAGETWGMFGTDFADIDNDGDLDIGSVSFGCCAGIHIYRNEGDGSWTHAWGFLDGNSAMDFYFADFNGDGFADFASSHGNGTVYLGDGTGQFRRDDGNLPGPPWRFGVSVGDVNNDGREDLAFVNTAGGLEVWSWAAPGTWTELSGSLPAAGDFDATQIADMNLDGLGDLVAFSTDALLVFAGDGRGDWSLAASIPTRPDTCGYAALRAGSDLDHNGFPDIGVIAEEDCDIFSGGTNRPRVFVEASSPDALEIFPRYPRGGEVFIAGSVRFVRWTAAVPTAPLDVGTVRIELSLAGSGGPWQPVADNLPNTGVYQWQLPGTLPSTETARLRYTITTDQGTASAITPASFTIIGTAIPGDFDGDGDVDIADFAFFTACFTGSGIPCAEDCCAADLDGDGDVDIADFAIFSTNFSGSQ